jgi:hypothetical protein
MPRIPPEYRPYMRRVMYLVIAAALLGVILALVIPPAHH